MSRTPPKVDDAPGLIWRPHSKGWEARWQARTDLINKGFSPKSQQVFVGLEPTESQKAFIQDTCRRLQDEMLVFGRGGLPTIANNYDGTLRSLINCYQTDPDSNYQKNRYHVRLNRDRILRRMSERHGHEEIRDIKGRTVIGWNKEWGEDGKKVATANAVLRQLRALATFGFTILEDPECERLGNVMSKMRFGGSKTRKSSVTANQAIAVRHQAREHFGWYSIALGQAFQFECTLRQKDVVGEWVPLSEPGVSAVVHRGKKWIRGIVWQEIDENLILRHMTSKKDKEATVDLKLAPMVMEEFQIMIGDEPLVVVDEISKKITVNRHLLPASGPILICDTNGIPWFATEYRRKWRKVANKAGVPKNVWNMDSRSGAISEAIMAGAPLEWVRHAATHSDLSQTADYDREQEKATAQVMRLRMENRNKPKTE